MEKSSYTAKKDFFIFSKHATCSFTPENRSSDIYFYVVHLRSVTTVEEKISRTGQIYDDNFFTDSFQVASSQYL